MGNKNLRRVSMVVTAQTAKNLEWLAQMDGQPTIVREKMLSLRQPEAEWKSHHLDRFGRVD